MKKTLFLLLATAALSTAETETTTNPSAEQNSDTELIYQVTSTPEFTDPTELHYSLGNGKRIPVNSVVTVGKHSYQGGPFATEGTMSATGFYVAEGGTLCIVGGNDKMTDSKIFTTTQGEGDIIVRSPGYKKELGINAETYELIVNDRTHVTGDLYLSPYCVGLQDDKIDQIEQTGVALTLKKGADISSFNSVNMCHAESYIAIGDIIGKSAESEGHGHIHNLTSNGGGLTYIFVNQGGNSELVLSGKTTLETYEHVIQDSGSSIESGSLEQYSNLKLVFNQNATITIEELVNTTNDDWYKSVLSVDSAFGNKFEHAEKIDGVVNIESFDYNGNLTLNASIKGSLHMNLNLKENQTLHDYQYFREDDAIGTQTMTITGEGTYILSDGESIKGNFGVLSTEKIGDKQVWRGTVEVNQLVANAAMSESEAGKNGINFADYGNDQSIVHFKGFKGYVYNTTENDAHQDITIGQDLILTNPEGSTTTPHAFELSNGFSDRQLHFTGDISGTGDFVVSAGVTENIFFKGDVSEWKDGAEFKVTSGTQNVTFQDNATEINADLVTTDGTMNATISNTEAVTVNGKVSKAEGGALNLTVSTAEGTTFTNEVNVSSLSVSGGSKASFEQGATAGDVSVGLYKGAAAEVSNGMTIDTTTENNITSTSISGGKAVNVDFVFDADKNNTVRNATLENVSISSVGGSSVLLENLKNATNVQLYGEEVNFCALEVENSFYLAAASETYNEIRLVSDAFAGMTLTEDGQSMITLTVNNDVNWNDASNENLNNVTIVLKGFKMEGVSKGEGWLSNLIITGDEDATAASLLTFNVEKSAGTELNVNELLAVGKYEYVTYEQKEDGLHIRMSNIPEPTTATLSLLALAAIAARRRRK